jgi:hypothetical protein
MTPIDHAEYLSTHADGGWAAVLERWPNYPYADGDPDEDARRVALIETCDFRRSSCGCLSQPAECLLAGYPAIVGREHCEACVSTITTP